MSLKYKSFKTKWYVTIPVILVSLAIFVVSVAQASWANISDDDNFDRFRINPVEFEIEENGEKITYYLPQVNQVPGQLFYPIKRIRDNLWLKMSTKSNRDAKLYLLLADKKIAEVLILSQKDNLPRKYMSDSAKASIDYLVLANKISLEMKNRIEADKVGDRVTVAKHIYSQILEQVGEEELSKKALSIETDND